MLRLSIKLKLGLAMMALITAVTAGLVLTFSGRLTQETKLGLKRSADAGLALLSKEMVAALDFGDTQAAQELLETLARQPNMVYAEVRDAKGALVVSKWSGSERSLPPLKSATTAGLFRDGYYLARRPVEKGAAVIGSCALAYSLSQLDQFRREHFRHGAILGSVVLILGMVAALVLGVVLTRPIGRLIQATENITSRGDLKRHVAVASNDEIGDLTRAFNAMLGKLHDVTASKEAADLLHRKLIDASRLAGKAEVATGVLHNVGNVLNSVNVSAALVDERIRRSRMADVKRVSDLLSGHDDDLGRFLSEDSRGKLIPQFLAKLGEQLLKEQAAIGEELQHLRSKIEHIKTIVATQQQHAKTGGLKETVKLGQLVDSAVSLNQSSFEKASVRLTCHHEDLPPISVDRHRVLQILVNLLSNARHAVIDAGRDDPAVSVTTLAGKPGWARICVADNGVGISPENLHRIFEHGFTTKSAGHGFGLHSSANAATEMGGSLRVESEGLGEGARFVLELPAEALAMPSEPLPTYNQLN